MLSEAVGARVYRRILLQDMEDIFHWYLTWERVDTGAEDLHAQASLGIAV
jgi:hypothetical protein